MAASAQSVPDLRIERIETIPVRVPLDRVYKGSHYKMTHRSTIITRVYTASGIVGEAYAGDEDAGLGEIDGIIHKEIAPKLIGEDAFALNEHFASHSDACMRCARLSDASRARARPRDPPPEPGTHSAHTVALALPSRLRWSAAARSSSTTTR